MTDLFCPNCGTPRDPSVPDFCVKCGESFRPIRKRRTPRRDTPENKVDAAVGEFLSSNLFAFILIVSMFGFGIYLLLKFTIAGPIIREYVSPTPYIVQRESGSGHIPLDLESTLNNWLSTSAPVNVPYYFVTSWQMQDDGRYLVSLAGVDLSSPDEEWTLVNDINPYDNKVLWWGTVEVIGENVSIYAE